MNLVCVDDMVRKHLIVFSIIIFSLLFAGCTGDADLPPSSDPMLVEFFGECGESDIGPPEPRIVEKRLDSGILMITVQTEATCCVSFTGEIVYADEILDLRYRETGEPCDCMCAAMLYYEILGASRDDHVLSVNGRLIN